MPTTTASPARCSWAAAIQWGNITAGIDLMRRLRGAKGHGLVLPLVTTSGGVPQIGFGKTGRGTIWLDPARTSPFRIIPSSG
jgi:tyrosyl-tRNA synthetase